jgi:hypothetical protein
VLFWFEGMGHRTGKKQLLVSIVQISISFFKKSLSILFVVTDTRESTAAMLSTSELESLK